MPRQDLLSECPSWPPWTPSFRPSLPSTQGPRSSSKITERIMRLLWLNTSTAPFFSHVPRGDARSLFTKLPFSIAYPVVCLMPSWVSVDTPPLSSSVLFQRCFPLSGSPSFSPHQMSPAHLPRPREAFVTPPASSVISLPVVSSQLYMFLFYLCHPIWWPLATGGPCLLKCV